MRNKFPLAPLMVSMDNDKHVSKIWEIMTDSVILNLEDGVSDYKKAVENLEKFLSEPRKDPRMLIIRTRPLFEGGIEEILKFNSFKPDAYRIPKVRNKGDVAMALSASKPNIDIHLSIETRLAWLELNNLKINERVTVFYLGILDLFADLGFRHELIHPDNPTVQYVLSHFLFQSNALGAFPVAPVFQDYKNTELFTKWLNLEKRMGYLAKGAISTTQVSEIFKTFVINDYEFERSRDIVEIYESMVKQGVHGFSHEKYGFIDEPIYKLALATLKLLS